MTVAHQSPDFELMPDLLCGRSYRNAESEAHAWQMREGEQTPFAGCGKPLRWVYAYRCRQCGRWLHGPCMDRHFGAERDAEINRLLEMIREALDDYDHGDELSAIDTLRAALAGGEGA
jgi:hypothetical protein